MGCRLRCSSVKTDARLRAITVAVSGTTSVSAGRAAARRPARRRASAITGSSTRPRSFSAVAVTRAAARDQLDARVDVGHVPAAVPARVFHSGAEYPAPARLDLQRHPREQGRVERRGGPAHPDPAGGLELCQVHVGPRLGHQARRRTVRTTKGDRRLPGGRLEDLLRTRTRNRLRGGATSQRCGSRACREPSSVVARLRAHPRSYRGGSGGRRLDGRSAVAGAAPVGRAASASRAIRTAVSSCGSRPAT